MKSAKQALLAISLVLAAGCARQAARRDNPLPAPGLKVPEVTAVARQVLRDMQFDVINPDVAPGRVETHPVIGAQWFEFWRPDTVGPRQHAESTLSTIRRKVTVSVTPTGTGSDVAVAVEKQRLSAPGSESSLVGQTYSLYGVSPTSMYRQDELEPPGGTWLDEGRDAELEQVILSRIYDRLGRPLPPS